MGLPRNYYQMDGGKMPPCDEGAAAFVRGILLETPKYRAMSFDEKFKLDQVHVYPRWRLYGGPFLFKTEADDWDQHLYFWGFERDLTWVSHGVVCVVPDWIIRWPADRAIRWEWVYETEPPAKVFRAPDGKLSWLTPPDIMT